MGGNTSKIVIYDNARVNGGTNYDAKGEDIMTLGHMNAALLSLLEFVFNIKYVWNIDEITNNNKIFSTSSLICIQNPLYDTIPLLYFLEFLGCEWVHELNTAML